MASAWTEEETFVCSVCLDTLKDPTTLPCGHSYCLECIKSHWDKKNSKGQYSCPQCRQVFNPRPPLAKSTVLVEALEKLRTNSLKQSSSTAASSAPPSMPVYLKVLPDTGPQQGSVNPQLPTVGPRPCPKHNRPLDLFCHEDKECVCEVCCQHGHKGHHVLTPQDERKERQKELVQMQTEVQKRIQKTEKKLKELPPVARQHKALVKAVEQESTDLFSELAKTVSLTGTQTGELLSTHETSLGSQVEGQIHRLEQEVVQLRWKSEELSRIADIQDHVCFLKSFLTMEPLGQKGATGESVLSHEEALVASIRSAMKELQMSIQDLCKASLAKIVSLVNHDLVASTPNDAVAGATAAANCAQANTQNTVYEMTTELPPLPPPQPQGHESSFKYPALYPACPQASAPPPPLPLPRPQEPPVTMVGHGNPEPSREELFKFRFEPTLDPNTVYRHVQLSDGGQKATMRSENLNPPDNPERFHFWRQVLCREALAGSPYYWEVEWTGQKITIGVAYKEMERKGSDDKSRLGHNPLSWSLYWSGTGFSFWHNGQEKLLGSPKAKRIGVYLDQHVGILAFYRITKNQADLIHRHLTQFTGPLYPGFRFWAGAGTTLTVCKLD
ncbi:finTRIM family, member 86 [Xiphias gladius]|uniref:finTRIM family, member 86 n=1 Tax=Xiphias gladius TaxID=8245 RepID=UPI001A99413F|nr:finTRIM family, member 86 [Xiphias gladius]XP_039987721.1 finTRIM family, member 86 [Xiphias gladius]XP_039987722.1 finTRIM family, member 86 [Xiphias gladius]XP_039987723.1 finTRIM family, member 86 [Xiphias gladius]